MPPPEAEEPAEIIRSAPQPINHQKHYKIIFIKAPSTSSKQIVHQQLQQTEEKTLVYVLVKKPEPVQEIHQIQAPSIIPSKPEVNSHILLHFHYNKQNDFYFNSLGLLYQI